MDKIDSKNTFKYDAFISYSREDKAFAEKLEKALENYKPPRDPRIPQRRLNIFRDEDDLIGTEYYKSIDEQLGDSTKLIVLCSTNARESEFVNDEIRRFAKLNKPGNIIPIIIGGIPNNEAKKGQEAEMAFPDALCEALEMPLAISYVGINLQKEKLNKGIFDGSWYTILANIYNLSRGEIEQRDKKKQQRRKRIIIGITSGVMIAILSLAIFALLQKNKALERMYKANYNLAKVFEGKALGALEDAREKNDVEGFKNAFLYANAALQQEIKPEYLALEWSSLDKLFDPEDIKSAFLQRWFSPAIDLNNDYDNIAFSPDGKYLASGVVDRSVLLWEVSNGKQKPKLTGTKDSPITSVAFSPDGKYLAAGVVDRSILLWEVSTGNFVRELTKHTSSVNSVAFSHDSKYLVSGSLNSVRLWDISTLNHVLELPESKNTSGKSVTFSFDGKYIAYGKNDGSVDLCDIITGKPEFVLEMANNLPVKSIAFSPNDEYFASGLEDGRLFLFKDPTKEPTMDRERDHAGHNNFIKNVAFSIDGKSFETNTQIRRMRTGYYNTTVRNSDYTLLKGHRGSINSLAFSSDGKYLVSGSQDRSVRLWDVSTRETILLIEHAYPFNSVVFCPNEDRFATDSGDGSIRLWDISIGKSVKVMDEHTYSVNGVAFSPDGKHLVSCSKDMSLRLWNVSTGESCELKDNAHAYNIYSVAFSPDSKYLATGSYKSVRLWTSTGEFVRDLTGHTRYVNSVVFSPDGKYLATGSLDKSVRLWNVSTGRLISTLNGHTDSVTSVAFSPDGKYLASGSKDKSVRLWDVASGKTVNELTEHTDSVESVAFCPDGKYLASGSEDKSVWLWDVTSGNTISKLIGHNDSVASVAFSPDGKYLASGSKDKSVRLWDIASGKTVNELTGHTDSVASVAFSPDGKHIASGSLDKSVRLWDVSIHAQFLEKGKSTQLLNTFFEGVTFCWQIERHGLEFKRNTIATLTSQEGYAFDCNKRFCALLKPPSPGKSKYDQILEWSITQLAQNK